PSFSACRSIGYGAICDNMQQGQGSYAPAPLLPKVRNEQLHIAKGWRGAVRRTRPSGDAHMNTLTFGDCNHRPDSADQRGFLLRWIDNFAEWQMRHAYGVINRVQTDKATITSVTQPSNANERSSTKP